MGSGVASVPLELGRKCQADLKQKANNRAILCSVFVCVWVRVHKYRCAVAGFCVHLSCSVSVSVWKEKN